MTPFDAISPFPTVFSSLSKTEIIIFVTFIICKHFQFGLVQNFVMWEWVKSYSLITLVNSLTKDKILDWLKAFAYMKFNVARMVISLLDRIENRVENTVGKGENAGYQHFLLIL